MPGLSTTQQQARSPRMWIGHRYDRALNDGLVAVNQCLNV